MLVPALLYFLYKLFLFETIEQSNTIMLIITIERLKISKQLCTFKKPKKNCINYLQMVNKEIDKPLHTFNCHCRDKI